MNTNTRFPNPGEIFEETYRVDSILGSGGFARVYRAIEIGLERPVALKILRPPVNTTQSDSQRDTYLETLMERFQREAQMLSRLRSPYTVSLHKFGKTSDGLLYMALEYIDGLSLAEIMRAGKPLEPARVAHILRQVLLSLQEAHTLGMLHRDLKPANVMVYEHLGEKDQVKLLDFGIAKLVQDAGAAPQQDLTSDGTLIGTPRYMAPEQIQGDELGPPADIYALGLVAYEMLTGERAIKGDSSIQIIGKQLAPQSFRVPLGSPAPVGLRDLINKMIDKKVSRRYQTCAEVIAALSAPNLLVADEDETDAFLMLPSDAIESLEDEGYPTVVDLPVIDASDDTPLKRSKLPYVVSGVVLMLLMVGLIAISTGDDGAEPAQTVEVTPEPVLIEEPEPLEVPKVTIAARMGGEELIGASVLIDGVEKGVTPMKIEADAVQDGEVLVRYEVPDSDEVLEQQQSVTTPRDITVDFDPVVVVRPPIEAKPSPKPEPEVNRTPRVKRSEPRPEPKEVQRRAPRQKKRSIYETLVPE